MRGIIQKRGFVIDDTDRKSERVVNFSHPNGVTARKVIVDRDDVHAFFRERIEVCRECGDERLSLAGAHFRDVTLMQNLSAEKLHVKMSLIQGSARDFARDGKHFRRELVERLAFPETSFELFRFRL